MLLSWFHVYVVDDMELELKGALGFHDGPTHSEDGFLFCRKCNESLCGLTVSRLESLDEQVSRPSGQYAK